MHKLITALVSDGVSNDYQLLKPSTVTAMITPQIASIDSDGLHLLIMNAANGLWSHDGGEDGVATIMAYNPSTKVGEIILCNQGNLI